jgi:hypothetical protein
MTDTQLLLFTLIETCERLQLERNALETLLVGAKVPGWKPAYERLSVDPEFRAGIHAKFQPLYDLTKREDQAQRALEELLRALPKPDKLN